MGISLYGKKNKKTLKEINIRNNEVVRRSVDKKWVVSITIISFLLSTILSVISSDILAEVGLLPAFFILLSFILIGILFDIIGIAVTSADEKPFHAMASRKISGANQSVWLIRNAGKVSSFCNDVIGDIIGIFSGVTIGAVIVYLSKLLTTANIAIISLCLTGLVASLTIGGKAVGKTFARNYSNTIVYLVALVLDFFGELFHKKEKKL